MLTLDIFGKLDSYTGIFDVISFQHNRNWYILKVIKERNNNHFYQQIYQLIKTTNYPLTGDAQLMLYLEKHHILYLWIIAKKIYHLYKRIIQINDHKLVYVLTCDGVMEWWRGGEAERRKKV